MVDNKLVKAIWIWVAFIYSMFGSDSSAIAKDAFKSCAGVEVRSVRSIDFLHVLERKQLEPEIVVSKPSSATTTLVGKTVTLVATGPVLGSMDSPEVEKNLICTEHGFKIVMTVTRSANYHGAVRQNVLWRPQTEVVFVSHKSQILVEATWKMVLDTGIEVQHDLQFSKQSFPIAIKKLIR